MRRIRAQGSLWARPLPAARTGRLTLTKTDGLLGGLQPAEHGIRFGQVCHIQPYQSFDGLLAAGSPGLVAGYFNQVVHDLRDGHPLSSGNFSRRRRRPGLTIYLIDQATEFRMRLPCTSVFPVQVPRTSAKIPVAEVVFIIPTLIFLQWRNERCKKGHFHAPLSLVQGSRRPQQSPDLTLQGGTHDAEPPTWVRSVRAHITTTGRPLPLSSRRHRGPGRPPSSPSPPEPIFQRTQLPALPLPA